MSGRRVAIYHELGLVVEATARGWYAGEGGLGARAATRDGALAKLRQVQALVRRLVARQPETPE